MPGHQAPAVGGRLHALLGRDSAPLADLWALFDSSSASCVFTCSRVGKLSISALQRMRVNALLWKDAEAGSLNCGRVTAQRFNRSRRRSGITYCSGNGLPQL